MDYLLLTVFGLVGLVGLYAYRTIVFRKFDGDRTSKRWECVDDWMIPQLIKKREEELICKLETKDCTASMDHYRRLYPRLDCGLLVQMIAVDQSYGINTC